MEIKTKKEITIDDNDRHEIARVIENHVEMESFPHACALVDAIIDRIEELLNNE